MALFRALETARPRHRRLFEDPFAIRFLEPKLRIVAAGARLPLLGWLIARFIDRRWPGPRLSAVVRTRVIDDLVSESLTMGCSQLVLLGAGYDSRPFRLPEAEAVDVFEVDHPATQVIKRARLNHLASGGSPRLHWVPVDFEDDSLGDSLDQAGFCVGAPTCVLWEGVFSYLTIDAIDATLAWIRRSCGAGSRVILTYVDQSALRPREEPAPWISAVSDAGEPFITGIDPAHSAEFFAKRGLRLVSDESTKETAKQLASSSAATIPGFYRVAVLEVTK